MVRDYSYDMFQKLCKTIDKVSETDWAWVWDKLSDVKLYFSKWIGSLDVERYIGNMDEYHTKVLDQHNTSIEKLQEIFTNVYSTDKSYHTYMSSFRECADFYDEALLNLYKLLHSGRATRMDYEVFNRQFSDGFKNTRHLADKSFSEIAVKQQALTLRKNIFGTVKSIIKGGVTILSAPVKIFKNPLSTVVVFRDLCDSVFGTGSHLAGVIFQPLGSLIAGSNKDRINELNDTCSGLAEVDSLVDSMQFEADRGNLSNVVLNLFKGGNAAIDALDISTNISSIMDKAALIDRMDGSAFKKGTTLVKYLLWDLGAGGDAKIPGGPYIPEFMSRQKAAGEILKKFGKYYELNEKIATDEDAFQFFMDKLIEKPEYFSTIKDLKGLYEDIAPKDESFYDFLCGIYGSEIPKLEIERSYNPNTDSWVRHLKPEGGKFGGGGGGGRFGNVKDFTDSGDSGDFGGGGGGGRFYSFQHFNDSGSFGGGGGGGRFTDSQGFSRTDYFDGFNRSGGGSRF